MNFITSQYQICTDFIEFLDKSVMHNCEVKGKQMNLTFFRNRKLKNMMHICMTESTLCRVAYCSNYSCRFSVGIQQIKLGYVGWKECFNINFEVLSYIPNSTAVFLNSYKTSEGNDVLRLF